MLPCIILGEFHGSLDDPSSFYIVDSKMPIPNAAAVTLEVSSPAHNKIHVGPVHHMLTMYFLPYVAIIFGNATFSNHLLKMISSITVSQ